MAVPVMIDYRKNKLDGNHKAIVDHLQRHGVLVEQIMQPVDIVGYYRGFAGFGEIKVPGSAAKFTRVQLKWIVSTPWPVAFLHSCDEALAFYTTGKGLTENQKYRLRQMLDGSKASTFTPAAVGTALGDTK